MHRHEPGAPHTPGERRHQVSARRSLFASVLFVVTGAETDPKIITPRKHRDNNMGPDGAACIAKSLALLTGLQSLNIRSLPAP